jgi:hypothetical protein
MDSLSAIGNIYCIESIPHLFIYLRFHTREPTVITFNRSQIVGAEFPDDDTVRFSGIQADHIYCMEINMDVRVSDAEILTIEGIMKRYTNSVCPQAVPVLQNAVGMSLKGEGWERRIMKEIGRKGCEHFAEIIIECGHSLDQARLSKAMWEALEIDPALDQPQFLENWIDHRHKGIS